MEEDILNFFALGRSDLTERVHAGWRMTVPRSVDSYTMGIAPEINDPPFSDNKSVKIFLAFLGEYRRQLNLS